MTSKSMEAQTLPRNATWPSVRLTPGRSSVLGSKRPTIDSSSPSANAAARRRASVCPISRSTIRLTCCDTSLDASRSDSISQEEKRRARELPRRNVPRSLDRSGCIPTSAVSSATDRLSDTSRNRTSHSGALISETRIRSAAVRQLHPCATRRSPQCTCPRRGQTSIRPRRQYPS